MITLETATPQMFPQVLPVLRLFNVNTPDITDDFWRRLFDYPWPSQETQRGFVLKDGDRVVGFFGTILFERQIAGRTEKFCNLTSWVTFPEYRNQSLLLFKKIQEDTGRTITCVSPHKNVYPLYRRCGFEDLETKQKLVLPRPTAQFFPQWFRCSATTNPDRIAAQLPPDQRALLEHHRPLRCGHLLVHTPQGDCYIIFTKMPGRRVNFCRVQFIGNREAFTQNFAYIQWRLFLASGWPFLMIDGRMAEGMTFPRSRDVALTSPYVFLSKTLKKEQIDNLYTEQILLNL